MVICIFGGAGVFSTGILNSLRNCEGAKRPKLGILEFPREF